MVEGRGPQDTWLLAMSEAWKLHGIDADGLFAAAGLDVGSGSRLDPGVLSDRLSHLWELAVGATGDPLIGLTAAPAQPLGSLGLIAHLMLACPTMMQALERLCQYVSFVLPSATAKVEVTSDRVRLVLHLPPGQRAVPPQRYDCMASLVLGAIDIMVGRPVLPRLVLHPLPVPIDPTPYLRAYRSPVLFGQATCAIDFDPADLDRPLPTANPLVAEWCDRLAADLGHSRNGALRSRIRELVIERLPKGDPRRDEVAAALHVSERTLQRRLAEEGTHFQELVDATRRELAQQFLLAGRLSPKQMSFELGFADPSNFYRACKRWFGHPPRSIRQSN